MRQRQMILMKPESLIPITGICRNDMNEKIVTFKLELTSLFTTIFEQAEKRMVLEERTAPVVTDEWQYIDMSHLLTRLIFENICREEKLDPINLFIDYALNHTSFFG
jgi:hypothetical protein